MTYNREAIIDQYRDLGDLLDVDYRELSPKDVVLLGSGAMVLLGIESEAKDLDVALSEPMLELVINKLATRSMSYMIDEVEPGFHTHKWQAFEFAATINQYDSFMVTDGITHVTPDALRDFYQRFRGEKYERRVTTLNQYLRGLQQ